jgi:hypothetical protein
MSLEQYRNRFITEIINAPTDKDVCRHCDAAVQVLSENSLHEHLIVRFIDRTIIVLGQHKQQFNHSDKQQRFAIAQLRLKELRKLRQQKLYN